MIVKIFMVELKFIGIECFYIENFYFILFYIYIYIYNFFFIEL
jgi:hypothetical protein